MELVDTGDSEITILLMATNTFIHMCPHMNGGDKKITLFQTAGDGIEHQQAAIFIAECSGRLLLQKIFIY